MNLTFLHNFPSRTIDKREPLIAEFFWKHCWRPTPATPPGLTDPPAFPTRIGNTPQETLGRLQNRPAYPSGLQVQFHTLGVVNVFIGRSTP